MDALPGGSLLLSVLQLAALAVMLARGGGRLAGALACVAVAGPALLLQPWTRLSGGDPVDPALLLQLVLPDLFAPGAGAPFAAACFGAVAGPWSPEHVAWVGTPGLLLALHGLAVGPGVAAWCGRGLVLVGLVGALLPTWGPWSPGALPVLICGLGVCAGTGLAALRAEPAERAANPTLVLSWIAVAWAAATAIAALQVGAATDVEALAPWLGEGAPSTPGAAAPLAAALRHVLDRAALAAFASMTALLLFLKSRGTLVTAVLVLLALADASRAWWPA